METKLLEIRDYMTCIPALAVRLGVVTFPDAGGSEAALSEMWILSRAGFHGFTPGDYVLLVKLETMQVQYDPHSWPGGRTMPLAHQWVRDNWDAVKSGQVVDVRVLAGEATEPAKSDRLRETT